MQNEGATILGLGERKGQYRGRQRPVRSARAAHKRKPGVGAAKPGSKNRQKGIEPAKRRRSREYQTSIMMIRLSAASRTLNIFNDGFLGFRFASPQALR